IAAVTAASHTAEIDAGKLAQTKAKDGRVKKFAAMMVSHHGDAKKKQDKLLTKEKLAPAESPVSAKVKSDSESAVASLKSATGVEFDKAYIDSQVKMHEDTLNALDTKLLPNVKHADLKAQLQEFRPKVEEHLKQAKELQTSLAAGPPAKKLARRRKGARGERPSRRPRRFGAAPAPKRPTAGRGLPSRRLGAGRAGCHPHTRIAHGGSGVVLSPA
ncbi:MAG TPA: DUF4142 domain-containing protein, partial [Polyangiaceae bacterium]|nr:DUF4142 domain-containing protein [Polyangiaceae bacterium]